MSDHAIDLDPTGHCLSHPQIRVRRPNANGIGFRTILTNGCPLCAIHPVKPMARRSTGPVASHALVRRDSGRRRSLEEDFAKSYCSSSDMTTTTVASSQSSSSCHSNLDDYHSSHSERKRVVCGMRYQDPESGRSGTYTGQVEQETQCPHGVGSLRLHDGDILDGEWSRGRLIQDVHRRERCPSRSRRESLSESLRSCRLEDEEHQKSQISRHPSRSRRESLSHSIRFPEEPHHYERSASRCRRESLHSLSRSHRFDEDDDDANSFENNSLGSHGEQTVATYSARESKSSLPKRSSGMERRPSRGYAEVKH